MENSTSGSFGLFNYVLFFGTLAISLTIGLYFGCFGDRQKTATKYLYGSGQQKAIPIGLSICSSAFSAIGILGISAEIYTFGIQFMISAVGIMLSLIITWTFITPIFCGTLKVKAPLEYFELRYDKKVRILLSFISILRSFLYLPTVLYASIMAFSEASGISLRLCITITGGACILYTMLGGFSSVIWTDIFQTVLIFASCLCLLCVGLVQIGGFSTVWKIASEGNRTQLIDLDLNPFKRLTLWSAIIGLTFNFAAYSSCSISTLQRFLALPNEKQAKISTFIGVSGYAIIVTLYSIIGLCMYAFYHNCDPIKSGVIKNSNQLISLFVSDLFQDSEGFSGLFFAGILSAGLSTLSADLNSISGMIYHDFIRSTFQKEFNEITGALIMKIIVLIVGVFYLIIAPLSQHLQYLYQGVLIFTSMTNSANLGIIILATAIPQSNSIGVILGTLISMVLTGWISFGSFYYGVAKLYELPISISNCGNSVNATASTIMLNEEILKQSDPFFLYKLSFTYIVPLGTLLTIIISIFISYVTETKEHKKPEPNLLIPYFRTRL